MHILKIVLLALFALRTIWSSFQPTQLLQSAREQYLSAFTRALRPRDLRTFRRFAEEEIILPDGPLEDRRYRADRMKWHIPVLAEYDRGHYRRFFFEGSRQSSKTLLGLQIPLMYHLFEIEESIIVGLPNLDFANDLWIEKIKPMIEKSRYGKYMPDKGPGSKGGKVRSYVDFTNGTRLRFMSEGFSLTSRVVIFTEVYRLKESGAHGKEAGAFFQIEKCTDAFGDSARIYGECIITDGKGNVHKQITGNTDTRIYMKCPHCGNYILPERGHFSGWETAKESGQARRGAYYTCNRCEEHWNEDDKLDALENCVLVHNDQVVDRDGTVTGPVPDTSTFGLSWNAMHSPFKTLASIAENEWNAKYDPDSDDSEQSVCNHVWTVPYSQTPDQGAEIDPDAVYAKIVNIPFGRVPDHCDKVTVGVDIGEYYHWFVAVAWAPDAQGYIIDYGDIPVNTQESQGELTGVAMLNALRRFRENKLKNGWMHTNGMKKPDLVFIDSGYGDYTYEIYQFVHESGQGVYWAAKGKGTDPRDPNWSAPKEEKDGIKLGRHWYAAPQNDGGKWPDRNQTYLVFMHKDFWKMQVHDRIMARENTSGSLYIYNADPQHHNELSNHLTAVKRRTILRKTKTGNVIETVMEKSGRPDHLYDSLYMALVAGDTMGIHVQALHIERPERETQQRKKPRRKKRRKIRSRY